MVQYDEIGDRFDKGKRDFFKYESDFARDFIKRHLSPSEHKVVIDVGCGAGEDMAEYEKMGFAAVHGVDPSEVMIEKARMEVAHPENVMAGSFENTGMPDNSVDYVTARYALHYLVDVDQGYVEVARILKPGGELVVTVDHPTADMVEGEMFMVEDIMYTRIKLYDGQVEVEFPLHNFTDYFSPTFFELFEVIEIVEHAGKDRSYQDGPNSLAFAARKK